MYRNLQHENLQIPYEHILVYANLIHCNVRTHTFLHLFDFCKFANNRNNLILPFLKKPSVLLRN